MMELSLKLVQLQQYSIYAQELVENALKALATFDTEADPLRAIATYIVERDH